VAVWAVDGGGALPKGWEWDYVLFGFGARGEFRPRSVEERFRPRFVEEVLRSLLEWLLGLVAFPGWRFDAILLASCLGILIWRRSDVGNRGQMWKVSFVVRSW